MGSDAHCTRIIPLLKGYQVRDLFAALYILVGYKKKEG
jgi:hypothetical protein